MNYNGKWSSTNPLPCPDIANLLKLTSNGIDGLVQSLCNCVTIDEYNDLGQLAFVLVILLLEQISEKMHSGQTLEDLLQ